jgi:hypothetical protein
VSERVWSGLGRSRTWKRWSGSLGCVIGRALRRWRLRWSEEDWVDIGGQLVQWLASCDEVDEAIRVCYRGFAGRLLAAGVAVEQVEGGFLWW